MNTNQTTLNNNISKTETKVLPVTDPEVSKPYIQYAADLQQLLFSKVEEYEQFRESVKSKLKG